MVDPQVLESDQSKGDAARASGVWRWVGTASGLAYVLLQSVALGFMSSAGWPDPGASRAEIVKTFAGIPASQLWIGDYLSVLAALCFIPFAARVAVSLRRAEDAAGWIASVAMAGGWLLVASELGGAGAVSALLTRAGHGLSRAEAMTLFDLAQSLLFLFWAGGALFLAASAIVFLKWQVAPRWLGGAAALIAAIVLVAPVSTQLLHIAATLLYLWVVAAGIVFMRTRRESNADDRNVTPMRSSAR